VKFCRFFPLAILSTVLNCFCSADYIERSIGSGPSSTVYSYIDDSNVNELTTICSFSVRPYREFPYLVIPNTYVLDIDIGHSVPDRSSVRSLLFNVINCITAEITAVNGCDQVKFLAYVPKPEYLNSKFLKSYFECVASVLESFGFGEDEDTPSDCDNAVLRRLFVNNDGLKGIKGAINLEIKDCKN
jgi:hypothetical protein